MQINTHSPSFVNWYLALVVSSLSIFGGHLNAQESHYWYDMVGARSTLVAGAVVAGANDNSAVFYNPANLAFLKESNIDISTDIYALQGIFIENGAGQNVNLSSTWLGITPSFVSGGVKIKGAPFAAITYAVFNRQHTRYELKNSYSGFHNIFENIPGDEYYQSNFDYRSELREDWVAVGFGNSISGNLAIGLSTFIAIRQNRNIQSTESTAFLVGQSNELFTVGRYTDFREINQVHVGNLWKLGASYRKEKYKIGLSITTPRMFIPLVSRSNIQRNFTRRIDTNSTINVALRQEQLNSNFKSPWIVDVGAEFQINKAKLMLRAAWFSQVKKHELTEYRGNEEYLGQGGQSITEEYHKSYDARKNVLNFAIGFEDRISDNINLLAGIRTDFNNADIKVTDRTNWTPNMNYWDLYHVSAGVEYRFKKGDELTFGLGYSFGRSKNDPMLENISEPDVSSDLLGPIRNNTSMQFNRLVLVLGLRLNFQEKK